MSLNFDFTRVEDFETLHSDEEESVISDAIVWLAMHVDMGQITEANHREFYTRVRAYERLTSPMLHDYTPDGERRSHPITYAQIKRRVGLRTNVATTTKTQWNKRMGELAAFYADSDIQRFENATD